jgi:hypothetical protein
MNDGRPVSEARSPAYPWLVARRVEHLSTDSDRVRVEAVNVVDVQVGDIAVITQLAGGRDIGAATGGPSAMARRGERYGSIRALLPVLAGRIDESKRESTSTGPTAQNSSPRMTVRAGHYHVRLVPPTKSAAWY